MIGVVNRREGGCQRLQFRVYVKGKKGGPPLRPTKARTRKRVWTLKEGCRGM